MEQDTKAKFIKAIPIGAFAEKYVGSFLPPFSPKPKWLKAIQRLAVHLAGMIEALLGEKLFVYLSGDGLLDIIPSRFWKLARELEAAGIAKEIYIPNPIDGWPQIPTVRIYMDSGISATGISTTTEDAAIRAFAECLERRSLYIQPSRRALRFGKFEDLKNKGAVDPASFLSLSNDQLGEMYGAGDGLTGKEMWGWAKARSFVSGDSHYIPAQLIFPSYGRNTDEILLRNLNSNGFAAGNSREMAMYHALSEVIERDSFIIHWLNKISPPRINLSSFENPEIRKIVALYRRYEIKISLFDITTDLGVPVMMSIVREDTPGRARVHIGMKSDLDKGKAALAALIDGLRAGFWKNVAPETIAGATKSSKDLRAFTERYAYWCPKERDEDLEFLDIGKEINFEDTNAGRSTKEKLELLRSIFVKKKIDAYVAESTHPMARRFGLFVYVAVAPELCPFYLYERFICLGSKRLLDAPLKMDVVTQGPLVTDLNHIPHPFL